MKFLISTLALFTIINDSVAQSINTFSFNDRQNIFKIDILNPTLLRHSTDSDIFISYERKLSNRFSFETSLVYNTYELNDFHTTSEQQYTYTRILSFHSSELLLSPKIRLCILNTKTPLDGFYINGGFNFGHSSGVTNDYRNWEYNTQNIINYHYIITEHYRSPDIGVSGGLGYQVSFLKKRVVLDGCFTINHNYTIPYYHCSENSYAYDKPRFDGFYTNTYLTLRIGYGF